MAARWQRKSRERFPWARPGAVALMQWLAAQSMHREWQALRLAGLAGRRREVREMAYSEYDA